MRTFILALTVFFLIIGVLVFTGRYLINRTSELTKAARNLPIFTEEMSPSEREDIGIALNSFVRTWNSTRKTIHFLVGHEEADRIDETLSDLRARHITHDTAGYMSARAKLLQAIARLADAETFSFDTIT